MDFKSTVLSQLVKDSRFLEILSMVRSGLRIQADLHGPVCITIRDHSLDVVRAQSDASVGLTTCRQSLIVMLD